MFCYDICDKEFEIAGCTRCGACNKDRSNNEVTVFEQIKLSIIEYINSPSTEVKSYEYNFSNNKNSILLWFISGGSIYSLEHFDFVKGEEKISTLKFLKDKTIMAISNVKYIRDEENTNSDIELCKYRGFLGIVRKEILNK